MKYLAATTAHARTGVDFRDSIHPSRTWILGIAPDDRVELLTADLPAGPRLGSPAPALPRPARHAEPNGHPLD
jgi:hypothetical protein